MRGDASGGGETPHGALPSSSPSHTPIGQHEAFQGSLPSNYAYDDDEGYASLLLYKLSPRLAQAVYPIIATRTMEAIMAAVLIIGYGISTPPLLHRSAPHQLVYASFLVHIPAFHRMALVHKGRALLLLRQFETWWVAHQKAHQLNPYETGA